MELEYIMTPWYRVVLLAAASAAVCGVAGCGSTGAAHAQVYSSSLAASPSVPVSTASSTPVPAFTNVTVLSAESCSLSATPTAPISLPSGASFPPALASPVGALMATKSTALIAADRAIPDVDLSAPVDVRLESWQDVVNASKGSLVVGTEVAPERCVWAISVHQQNAGDAPAPVPGQAAPTYNEFSVVIDEATGYQVDFGDGVDLTG